MPEESRKEKRSFKRLKVRFGQERPDKLGYSRNISRRGMFLQSTTVFPRGTRLLLEVSLPTGTVPLMGVVAWARTAPARLAQVMNPGMGIRLLEPPPEFERLME